MPWNTKSVLLLCFTLIFTYDSDADVAVDRTFGNEGIARKNISNGEFKAQKVRALLELNDGKIVVAADNEANGINFKVAIVRYLQNGELDLTFGDEGRVELSVLRRESASDLLELADGQLIFVGSSGTNLLIFRLESDGSLVESFGDSGLVSIPYDGSINDEFKVVQQNDGKLLVTSKLNNYPILYRFNLDGSFDATFGNNGQVTFEQIDDSKFTSLVVQDNGKIAVGGEYELRSIERHFLAVRFLSNGTLDSSFANNGVFSRPVVSMNTGNGKTTLLRNADGQYTLVGDNEFKTSSGDNVVLIKLSSNGVWDEQFGLRGKAVLRVEEHVEIYSAKLTHEDKIVVVGSAYFSGEEREIFVAKFQSDGDIEHTFATNGVYRRAFEGGAELYAVHIGLGGNVIVGGGTHRTKNSDLLVLRFGTNGVLDHTFASQGVLLDGIYGSEDSANSIVQQADGKLVAAGNSQQAAHNIALVRFTEDGLIDSNFGVDGVMSFSVSEELQESQYSRDSASSIIQQQDGKLIVVGSSTSYEDRYSPYKDRIVVARLLSNGTKDMTFGSQGLILQDIEGASERAFSVIQQPNQKLLVAGAVRDDVTNQERVLVVRYNLDGSLDSLFAEGGLLISSPQSGVSERALDIILQSDGKIVISGVRTYEGQGKILTYRFNTNGSKDLTFGINGAVESEIPNSIYSYASSVAQQKDGKLVVSGSTRDISNFYKLVTVRLDSNGNIDDSFGVDGMVMTDINPSESELARHIIQQQDSKLVIVAKSGTLNNYNSLMIRYNHDGTLDTSFDEDGIFVIATNSDVGVGFDKFAYNKGSFYLPGGDQTDFSVLKVEADIGFGIYQSSPQRITIDEDNFPTSFSLILEASNNNSNTTLTWNVQTQGMNGQARVLDAEGNSCILDYIPNLNFNGADQFVVVLENESGESATMVVEITINPVNDPPEGNIKILGNMQVGELLSASNSLSDVDGLTEISYVWKRQGLVLSTSDSYRLTNADVGSNISLTASYVDSDGTPENVSITSSARVQSNDSEESEQSNRGGGGLPLALILVFALVGVIRRSTRI